MTIQLNTLFVVREGAFVGKDHEAVVVKDDGHTIVKVPLHHLDGIVCFGNVAVSPYLLHALMEGGSSCAYFSANGRFLGRAEGLGGRSLEVRRAQFRIAEQPGASREIVRSVIAAKVANSRTYLQHASRDSDVPEDSAVLGEAAEHMSRLLHSVRSRETVEELRGLEGAAARDYFGAFASVIKVDRDVFGMIGRSRRPPRDPINAMLSFGYSLLMRDCAGACAAVGLEPALGFLHEPRPGRLGLALDLMEELRTPVVDRLVVRLVNRRQVSPDSFVQEGGPAVRLKDDARKLFLAEYQKAKQGSLRHEYLDQQITWQQLPHIQARLLARVLRGDLETYPAFRLQ